MPSTSETGHAKNAANFLDLISFCQGYGAVYNPSKAALTIAALQTKLVAAQTDITAVNNAQRAFNNATNARMLEFKPLKALATRIINALDATDATTETVKDAKTINKKLQGQRATPKPEAPAEGATPPDNTISTSQQSYDQQIEHFSRLIGLVAAEPSFTPNEADLTPAALQAKLATLQSANADVVTRYTTYSNSRINRNEELYNPLTGLVAIAMEVKKYVKSVFGASSPQYKQISGLQFRKQPSA